MAELQCFPEGPYISTVKLGPKGQIVIPKEIRSRSGVRPGDNLVLVANAAGSFSVHPADRCRDLAAQLLVQLPTVLDILTHEEQPSATSSANNPALEGEAL